MRALIMSIFDFLTMIGGLCLFLFGMSVMGQALERRAGGRLRQLLGKMTGNVAAGKRKNPRRGCRKREVSRKAHPGSLL